VILWNGTKGQQEPHIDNTMQRNKNALVIGLLPALSKPHDCRQKGYIRQRMEIHVTSDQANRASRRTTFVG
jgi:hypothetical protein